VSKKWKLADAEWPRSWADLSNKQRFIVFFQLAEIACKDPAFLEKASLRYWKNRGADRKQIARKEVEARAAKKKSDFTQKALHGTYADELIANYLVAYNGRQIELPDSIYDGKPEGELFAAIHFCIVQNRSTELRSIADAVRRVHARAEGEGNTFRVRPAKPGQAVVARMPIGGTLPTRAREIKQLVAEAGDEISDTTARRIIACLGIEPARRGRPRKKQ
jgi:hypothetical protein